MKVILIEDEKPAALRLSKLIEECDPEIKIEQVLDSVEASVNWLKQHESPSLIFMDIHLSDGSSFEIFKQVKLTCPVIFITAYDQHALDAFKVNSVDYLLKPVRKEELQAALNKFHELHGINSPGKIEQLLQSDIKPYKDRFVIKLGNKIKSVMVSDISYFYSKDKLSFICDKEGKHYPVDFSLEKIEGMLNPQEFFRVNRQIITHQSAIKDIQTSIKSRIVLTLQPPTAIESVISSERSSLFKKWLKQEI